MSERVWEKFLTEQDRRALGGGRGREDRVGFGSRPALLLIDLYRSVFGDKPLPIEESIKDWPGSCGLAGWEAIPHIQKLLAAARKAGIPVFHTTNVATESTGMMAWAKGERARAKRESSDPAALERRLKGWEIIPELAPIDGEVVIRKASPSAFFGTALVGQLLGRGIDTLLIGGESTSGCVRASAVDSCTFRLRTVVVEECVFDRHQAPHAINLFDLNQKYADVVPLAEALEYLGQVQARQQVAAEPQAVAAR